MSDPFICNHLNEGKLVSDAWYYAEFLRSYNTFCVSFRVRDSSGKTGVRYERGLAADSPTPVDRRENRGHAISFEATEITGTLFNIMQERKTSSSIYGLLLHEPKRFAGIITDVFCDIQSR